MNKFIGNVILLWGVLFGCLAYLSDILFVLNSPGLFKAVEQAGLAFTLLQPLWYLFHFLVYILSHNETNGMKCKYACVAPLYMLLMLIPIMPNFKAVYEWFTFKFKMSDQSKLFMFTSENTFRISVTI
jgi:hypothetical protein